MQSEHEYAFSVQDTALEHVGSWIDRVVITRVDKPARSKKTLLPRPRKTGQPRPT